MSAWRLAVRGLYALGGHGTAGDLQRAVPAEFDAGKALKAAAALGLVELPGRGSFSPRPGRWHLTRLGLDWCENRVSEAHGSRRSGVAGRGRMRFVATWVSSLPRGIRLGQEVRS